MKNSDYNIVWYAIKSKQYDLGLNLLSSFPDRHDESWLIAKARCLQGKRKYKEAINTLQSIDGWEERKNVLSGLAFCYEKMKYFDHAINTFKSIKNWEKDSKVLFSLAHCYTIKGDYYKAIDIYNFLPRSRKVLISTARCYQTMRDFDAAIHSFQEIFLWAHDKQVLIGISRCYQEMRDWDKARRTLMQVENWQEDEDVLLGLNRCSHLMGELMEETDSKVITEFPISEPSPIQWAPVALCMSEDTVNLSRLLAINPRLGDFVADFNEMHPVAPITDSLDLDTRMITRKTSTAAAKSAAVPTPLMAHSLFKLITAPAKIAEPEPAVRQQFSYRDVLLNKHLNNNDTSRKSLCDNTPLNPDAEEFYPRRSI